ncbi:(E 0.0) Ran GTPase binding chromatin binding zinc ion binding [Musa troglodytarum]|uniref:(E 0.0) Ran GTPase binding chromatin binding zinc ion binding n=1 Tax=Musa troglodytarum TaxID=320322 RepID=A0A9E7GXN4_9LILI|nr:(E 0.0) Ran GTPase binding chromatin binding zinc ion binding [Musa troglodytarum]URE20162.1 (E 0.0) Ran GTPase binding chromatin binding zinc ion binding [Musa troglodytarum]
MADPLRNGSVERDVEQDAQAITALKKGAHLLKYGRRGKPKFCPFRLSNDESLLIWYSGKDEKQLKLSQVSKIIPGQRTAIFQRYPRPDKEYQSFSLIYNDRSLDLICKDKDEAEVWFVGLKALISHGTQQKLRSESRGDRTSSDSPSTHIQKISPFTSPFSGSDISHKDSKDDQQVNIPYESHPVKSLGRVFSDVILYTAPARSLFHSESLGKSISSYSSGAADNANGQASAVDTVRVSLSSAVSSSSHGSGHEDFDALGDVFIWGEGLGDGVLGGGLQRVGISSTAKIDASLPKALESAVVLDVHNLACGRGHAVLVTKQGEVFSWGEESGGRLGHGNDADVSQPKLIDALSGMNVELVACGEYHTCAVTLSGDLYTWGDGVHSSGLLGHGSDVSHWIPKKVCGPMEGQHVSSVSCGPWHTAIVTSAGQLFTFGDGIFGALGHGDRRSTNIPREVEALRGMRAVRAACGVWHTAAIVEILDASSDSGSSSTGKLFTWGDGDKGRLGHGDGETRLLPTCVISLSDNFCKVACGHDITIGLTTSGRVYTMGSTVYGQLGNPEADGKLPARVEGKIYNSFVEEISCGSYHVAVLTSRTEVYTWGKGTNGRLGHGDSDDRNTPTLVEALKDKQVKSVVCGASFTAVICLHKWICSADQSICAGCHLPFGFRRKRHNCYNCGSVFCKACSSKKSTGASLAPNINKPYRVCDECYTKLKKAMGDGKIPRFPKHQSGSANHLPGELADKDSVAPRMQGQFSRLSSVESFKGECRDSRESNNRRHNPIPNQLRNLYPSSSSKFLQASSKKIFSASVPGSRVASRSTSPTSCKPSSPHSMPTATGIDLACMEILDVDSKPNNEDLRQEVIMLQAQVAELMCKSRLLEVELQKATKQLIDTKAIASEETAKCKAAKEVIKSLTSQVSESNSNLGNPLASNGNHTLPEAAEWVEQAEPAEKDLASNKQRSGGQRIDHGFRRNIPFLAGKILPLALLKHLAGRKAWLTKQWCHKLSSPSPPAGPPCSAIRCLVIRTSTDRDFEAPAVGSPRLRLPMCRGPQLLPHSSLPRFPLPRSDYQPHCRSSVPPRSPSRRLPPQHRSRYCHMGE